MEVVIIITGGTIISSIIIFFIKKILNYKNPYKCGVRVQYHDVDLFNVYFEGKIIKKKCNKILIKLNPQYLGDLGEEKWVNKKDLSILS